MANLDRDPTLYLDEMQKFLLDRHQVKCSISAIKTALKEHNITRKQVYSKASQVIEGSEACFHSSNAKYNHRCEYGPLY